MLTDQDLLQQSRDFLAKVPAASEVVTLESNEAIGLVALPGGKTRVVKVSSYYNRQHRPQVTMMFKDFSSKEEAETLYLNVLELHGFLAFGDAVVMSKSGLRIRRIE